MQAPSQGRDGFLVKFQIPEWHHPHWALSVMLVVRMHFVWLPFVSLLPLWCWTWTVSNQCKRPGFDPWVGRIPWRREWLLTPVVLSGESHGQRSLVDYSPQGHKEWDTTEWLTLSLHRRHYHWQRRGKVYERSLCLIFYNWIWTYLKNE